MRAMADIAAPAGYPIQLDVDYAERQSRWKALLRLPLSIPLLIFSALLQGGVALTIWAAILVSGWIPTWLFTFQVAVNQWQLRAAAYFLILTDGYPPFEGDYAIRYDVQYPNALSRWRLVIWKFITSVPHFIVLAILALTLVAVMPISWFAILFTGRFPQVLHGYVSGILRWGARVQAYFLSLTDEYPPFSLSADAGSGSQRSYVLASGVGVLTIAGAIAGVAIFLATVGEQVTTEVSYEALLAGEVTPEETRAVVTSAAIELTGATDSADELFPFLAPETGYRFVQFDFTIENVRPTSGPDLRATCFSLEDTAGDKYDAQLLVIGGQVSDLMLDKHEVADALVLFEVPEAERPAELRYSALDCTFPILPEAEVIIYQFH